MPGNTLEQKIREFNLRHGATLTMAMLDAPPKKFKGLDLNFFDRQKRKAQRAILYHRTVATVLMETLKNGSKINETGYYALPDLDMTKFLDDFEEIMKLRQEETEYDRVRKPFEGINQEKLFNHLVDLTKRYDRSLSEIWADSILKEEMTIAQMKAITDRTYSEIKKIDPNNMSLGDTKKLGSFHTALITIERVREKRGAWWKFRHPLLNGAEKAYHRQLLLAQTEFTARGLSLAQAWLEHDTSPMEKVYKTIELARNRKNMDESEKQMQENMQEQEQRRREISNVHEKLQPLLTDLSVHEKISEEIVKALPRCRWEKPLQKNMLSSILMKTILQDAQSANEDFDVAVSNGRSPEAQMVENVRAVFQKAYANVATLGYMDVSAQLVAAQVITDVVLKNMSPAAFDEKKYAEFTNGYVLKHATEFSDITDMDGSEPAYVVAKEKYNEMQREKIEVSEVNVIANEPVVAPVDNQPSQEVQIIKN